MTAGIGHNSETVLQKDAQTQLKSIVERLESLIDNDLHDIKTTIKEVFAEAKGNGYDVKALREIIRRRAKDRAKLAEENAVLALYASALGCEDLI
jgi:uncharacterized protein (UPF0335 family)